MSIEAATRPNVQMSQEEHGAIAKLTSAVEVLASNQNRTETLLGKFVEATEARFASLADRGRFSRGDVLAMISAAVAIAGIITALLSMRIDTALAPIQTQNQVSINDRAGLHVETAKIETVIAAGKDARLAFQEETRTRLAVLEDHDKQRQNRR